MWGIKQMGILTWGLAYSGPVDGSFVTFYSMPTIGASYHAQPQGAPLYRRSS